MSAEALPLPSLHGVDDLLALSQQGIQAGNALDAVKGTLTEIRDKRYREMLNATDSERVLALRYELRAIEALAQALLVKEARGEAAYLQLMASAGLDNSRVEPAVLRPEKTPPRKRPSRAKRATAQ